MKVLVLGLQWVVFHAGVLISAPVMLGPAFQLNAEQTGAVMQLTLLITGLGSVLQYFLGHKLSLIEGVVPAWWAAYIVLAAVGTASGRPIELIRTDIQGGMILTGGMLVLLGSVGIIKRLGRYITPRITGVMLFLFAVQVGGVGIKSLLGHGWIELVVGGAILLFILFLLFQKSIFLSQSAILIGVLVGWVLFLALGIGSMAPLEPGPLFSLPTLFLWGTPTFELGTILSLCILGLLLVLNVVASIKAMEHVTGEQIPIRVYDRGLAVTGISCGIAGITGGVGTIPMAISAGLLSVTEEHSTNAFLLASILLIVIGLVAPLGRLLSSIPITLAGSILLISVSSLISFGIRSVSIEPIGKRETFIVGLGLLIGIGILSLPVETWRDVPLWARGFVSNGVIIGTIFTILLEHGILRAKAITDRKVVT